MRLFPLITLRSGEVDCTPGVCVVREVAESRGCGAAECECRRRLCKGGKVERLVREVTVPWGFVSLEGEAAKVERWEGFCMRLRRCGDLVSV